MFLSDKMTDQHTDRPVRLTIAISITAVTVKKSKICLTSNSIHNLPHFAYKILIWEMGSSVGRELDSWYEGILKIRVQIPAGATELCPWARHFIPIACMGARWRTCAKAYRTLTVHMPSTNANSAKLVCWRVRQWCAAARWCSLDTPASSTRNCNTVQHVYFYFIGVLRHF